MLYLNKTKQNLLCVSIVILFLLIDLGQFFFMAKLVVPLLLCFYCMLIVHNPHYLLLSTLAFLLGLESFCFYNSFSLACPTLLAVSMLGVFLRKNLYPSAFHLFMVTFIGIIIQTYAIEGYFSHIWPTDYYTIMRISGTLFITICFSLTINIWGVQDNRA